MKRILLIEDDEPKLNQIVEFLQESAEEHQLIISRSLNSACKEIDMAVFDVILLDMSIPTFDGGKTANASGRQRTYGGKDFLMYMWEMEYHAPTIVVTQFKDFPGDDGAIDMPDLHLQLTRDYPSLYRGHVYFEHNSDAWKSGLGRLMENVKDSCG